MLSFSQYGGMSRADAIRIGPAFLLPKIGSMANVRCMVSGAKPTFEQFDLTKIELLGGIMKTVVIKDYYGDLRTVPVSDEVYEEWMDLRREEDRQRKKIAYHRSGTTLYDLECGMMAGLVEEDPVSDEVLRSDETKRLYEAISQLPPIQQRRIMMLLEDMNCNQIAKAEGRHPSVIYRSVEKSFLHLRALLQG
mgnify:FL=1